VNQWGEAICGEGLDVSPSGLEAHLAEVSLESFVDLGGLESSP
jgi:hypothetical protein